jgi:hypothetical protein
MAVNVILTAPSNILPGTTLVLHDGSMVTVSDSGDQQVTVPAGPDVLTLVSQGYVVVS